jgi:hypothetical protein
MKLEIFGLIVILLGYLGWVIGPQFAIWVFISSTLLGASAAITLTSLGFATIQPAYLLLGFIVLSALVHRSSVRLMTRILAFPRAGFWLLLTASYAVLSAIFFPRLFHGATYVFAVARTDVGPGIVETPLAPVSGNITQTVYFLGDLVCFLVFYVYASRPTDFKVIVKAILGCATINLSFSLIDLATYWANFPNLLSFLRNGNYSMLDEGVVFGFKRIVGSFAEASTFAYCTTGLFAFCTILWLEKVYSRLAGALAVLSLLVLIFSTSSTGYAGVCGFLLLLVVMKAARVLTRPVTGPTLAFVTFAPVLLLTLIMGLRLHQPTWAMVDEVINGAIVNKLSSSSGIERVRWNSQALSNFTDTYAMGGGVGSVRASSFPIAVLGNIGAIGALTYGGFLFAILFGRKNRWAASYPAACQSAARWACVAQLIGASVSGSFLDLGLLFFIFAGLACAGPDAGGRLTAVLSTERASGRAFSAGRRAEARARRIES